MSAYRTPTKTDRPDADRSQAVLHQAQDHQSQGPTDPHGSTAPTGRALSSDTQRHIQRRREARAKLPCAQATLLATDRAFRFAQAGLRALLYLALSGLASSLPNGPHLLTGFLLADLATWAVGAAFDVIEHPRAIAIEFCVAVLATWLWTATSGTSLWPDSGHARYLILAVAIPVCWVKGIQIYRRRAGLVETPWWERGH